LIVAVLFPLQRICLGGGADNINWHCYFHGLFRLFLNWKNQKVFVPTDSPETEQPYIIIYSHGVPSPLQVMIYKNNCMFLLIDCNLQLYGLLHNDVISCSLLRLCLITQNFGLYLAQSLYMRVTKLLVTWEPNIHHIHK